jgi:pimeloyl-ACP methyl ester carboxylesterase
MPPPGFISEMVRTNGAAIHCVRGGHGPAVVLIHGFPEDWVEYKSVMPTLARQFTVVAVDLPGIGRSAPSDGGYTAATLAGTIKDVVDALELQQPYLVGHDLGGIVAYAYLRRFSSALRGAMILDVALPGMAGWHESTSGFWHIGFIQAPNQLAEQLVAQHPAAFLGSMYDIAKFTADDRSYYVNTYGASQIHAAFEIYRAFPKDGEWNEDQSESNSTPLVVAVGENSFFFPHLQPLLDGYRAKGMTSVESEIIDGASHYVIADNPKRVAELIERHAARQYR